MGIKLVRFQKDDLVQWGVLEDELYVINGSYRSLRDILTTGMEDIVTAKQTGHIVTQSDITILSPVTDDANIYCQGTNYSAHRVEAGFSQQKPPYNLLFTKASSTLTSATANIVCPAHVRLLDYEIELGIIMKQDVTEAVEVTEHNLKDYIAGLVITNDVSARDVQIVEQQWFKGKSYRGFCPTGPYIYLLEDGEIDYLEKLELHLTVNGEIRQQVKTDQLLFKPTETLTEMSSIFDLNTGDLILTGTPAGVGLRLNADILGIIYDNSISYEAKVDAFYNSQKDHGYLQPGDVMRLEIKSEDGVIDLGVQENKIVQTVAVK
ncbi:MAG: fumarylacetoacetate hydrolase family protein [Solibacillus sp.]|uniref:fumarylacetoacetate hydrolase family protein n=1 Tax=Solibacillus sp. TaxID=1909654 RepID=UPI003314D1FD